MTTIHRAIPGDIPGVLELIKELAKYERAETEVELTIDELHEDTFGNDPVTGIFVAKKQQQIIGIALYYIKYSTWKGRCLFLEDIIVTESERRNGIGKLLFEEVARHCFEKNYKRMEWQVLEWNEPAIEFYKKLNSRFDNEWINCKLTFEDLQKKYNA